MSTAHTMQLNKRIKLYADEKFIVLPIKKSPRGNGYALTNYGRVISFATKPEDGHFLRSGSISEYPGIAVRSKDKSYTFLIHRLVAKYFLKKPSPKHRFVIHLNYIKDDNYFKNLKWVTSEEKIKHLISNPQRKRIGNQKLKEKQVLSIKKMLQKGTTSLKALANKFGVTDMQIHRIKTGENWAHVKI
jgi:DNA-binding Xre family transcriptional regulator